MRLAGLGLIVLGGVVAACGSDGSDGPERSDGGGAGADAGADAGAPPHCMDGVMNDGEADVDCGSSCPAACPDGSSCGYASECASGFCAQAIAECATPTCDDGYANQDESDIDCGGECGPTCADGKGCGDARDCASGFCTPDSAECAMR